MCDWFQAHIPYIHVSFCHELKNSCKKLCNYNAYIACYFEFFRRNLILHKYIYSYIMYVCVCTCMYACVCVCVCTRVCVCVCVCVC